MKSRRQIGQEFMSHILSAGEGAQFEIGECFEPISGWRVYIRVGEKALVLGAKEARSYADHFETMALRPEWKTSAEWARDNAKTLRECALVVVRKNRDRAVPEGYADLMPVAGSA